jgi:predicted lipoprotein with Yx(FWY)xxD motif
MPYFTTRPQNGARERSLRIRIVATAGVAVAAMSAAACSSSPSSTSSGSGGPPSASAPASGAKGSGAALKTATINGVSVVTNTKGLTLYSFAPDTATTSKCAGPCAQIWPPVTGSAAAGQGITGKLSTITRPDGSKQAAYNGHPLYTYTADTAPGQANGNGLNVDGGVWHEVTASGQGAPAGTSGGGVNGY